MEKDFLTLAGSLAAQSRHPGAPDIARISHGNGCPHHPVVGFQDFPERGFGGVVQLDGESRPRAALFGLREFIVESGLDVPAILEVAARAWEAEGALVIFGGWDGYVRGLLKFIRE